MHQKKGKYRHPACR